MATVGAVSVSPTAFPAAPSGPSALAARRRYGARVTFTLNEAAAVRFTVVQPRPGRSTARGACTRPNQRNRKARRCTLRVKLPGSFTLAGQSGTNAFRFTGRLAGRTLKPGRYELVGTPTANGRSGQRSSGAFRVVR
jgi:hypothetical protein